MKAFIFGFVFLFSITSFGKELTLLGERSSQCSNKDGDDFILEMGSSLKAEAKGLFDSNRLKAALVKSPDCYRVGTEIQLFLKNETIPYLGRALVRKVKILNKSQLFSEKDNPFSKSATSDFVKENPSSQYGVVLFDITEKIEEAVVDTEFQRLPTCFPSYGDWESLRLKEDQKDLAKDIRKGKVQAMIWNGTLNCYKVGVYTSIDIEKSRDDENGYIVPTQLHLVHLSNLEWKHANLLGENLFKLKKRLEEKKDLDGGYVSMVVFDYAKTLPEKSED